MILKQIFGKISDRALIRRYENAQLEMNKYVNIPRCWDVSEGSVNYVRELYDIQEMVFNFAKKNNVHVDMFVPKDSEVLSVTVSKLNNIRRQPLVKSERVVKLINEPVTMVKDNSVMLENKDGLNYIAKGQLSTEDSFIRQVYRAVSDLTREVLTK